MKGILGLIVELGTVGDPLAVQAKDLEELSASQADADIKQAA